MPNGAELIADFKIVAFRAFSTLRLDDLRRVNLIVGRNSVGKSSLLEALQIWATGGSIAAMDSMLRRRGEVTRVELEARVRLAAAWEALFHGRRIDRSIVVGPSPGPSITVEIGPWDRDQPGLFDRTEAAIGPGVALVVRLNDDLRAVLPLDQPRLARHSPFEEDGPPLLAAHLAAARGDSSENLSDLWDNIVLTGLEEAVLDALRLLDARVERLTFIRRDSGIRREPVVKLRGSEEPLPIRTLGDGMSRVLQLVLGLVNSRNGLFLVDEIENGIHYAAQPRLMDLMARLAAALNVQVFATTHSWDAVIAFQEALGKGNEGTLIRLESDHGETRAITFDPAEVAIAARESIEIR